MYIDSKTGRNLYIMSHKLDAKENTSTEHSQTYSTYPCLVTYP